MGRPCSHQEELIRERNYGTITELVEAARVGHITFDQNFDTIDDILRMRCGQVIDGVISYLQEYRRMQTKKLNTSRVGPVLRYHYLHSDLIELLMVTKRIDLRQKAFYGALESATSV